MTTYLKRPDEFFTNPQPSTLNEEAKKVIEEECDCGCQAERGDSMDAFKLIIEFRKDADADQITALMEEFEIVVHKVDGLRYHVSLPQREFMGTADIEDLSEDPLVRKVFWDDGSPCHPRG